MKRLDKEVFMKKDNSMIHHAVVFFHLKSI